MSEAELNENTTVGTRTTSQKDIENNWAEICPKREDLKDLLPLKPNQNFGRNCMITETETNSQISRGENTSSEILIICCILVALVVTGVAVYKFLVKRSDSRERSSY